MLFKIPEQNMEFLQKDLDKFEKKCKKLDCQISFSVNEETFETLKAENGTTYVQKFFIIDLEGEVIVNGWALVCVIEHTNYGNIIRVINDTIEVPKYYRSIQPYCEHCNTNRRRKETFLLFNQSSNTYKLVGRSCLKDFLGVDVCHFGYIHSIVSELEDKQNYNYESNGFIKYINSFDYLCVVNECIRMFGFISKTKSEEECQEATSQMALRYLEENFLDEKERIKLDDKNYCPDNKENMNSVKMALEAIETYEDKGMTDYINNLKCVSKMEYVQKKHIGILASLMAWHYKELDKIRKQKEQKEYKDRQKQSQFVGKVGDKIHLENAQLKMLTSFDGQYGTTHLYQITSNTNIFIWFTTKFIDNGNYVIDGAVKDHKLYEDVKQTIITRCKVAKIIAA